MANTRFPLFASSLCLPLCPTLSLLLSLPLSFPLSIPLFRPLSLALTPALTLAPSQPLPFPLAHPLTSEPFPHPFSFVFPLDVLGPSFAPHSLINHPQKTQKHKKNSKNKKPNHVLFSYIRSLSSLTLSCTPFLHPVTFIMFGTILYTNHSCIGSSFCCRWFLIEEEGHRCL